MLHTAFSVRWRLICLLHCSSASAYRVSYYNRICMSGEVLQNHCSLFHVNICISEELIFFSALLWHCSTIVIFCSTSAKNIDNDSPANFISTKWSRTDVRCVNCTLDKLVRETWCLVSVEIQLKGTETYSVSVNEFVIQGPVKWNP